MKALVKFDKGRAGMALREVEIPEPGEGELLIRILAAGICGTDLHIMKDHYPCTPPVVLGHEYTGVVSAVGEGVQDFRAGDQVVSLTAVVTCGRCRYCRKGLLMLCDQRASIGSGVDGAMAEYMKIPADLAFKLPPNVAGNDRMAIAEPAACAIRAVLEQSRVRVGDRVLVSGPGAIGQLTLWMAKLQGAFVIVSGTGEDEERLACAKALGADRVVSGAEALDKAVRETDGGVDVAFECAGAPASLYACVGALRKKGILSQVGLYGGPIRMDLDQILYKELQVTVSYATGRSSWDILLGLMAQGKLDGLDRLISGRFPLSDWEKAFTLLEEKKGFKYLLIP